MKKLAAIAFLLLFMPVTAHAHSGLASSTPAEGEILAESPSEIELFFESPIQQGDMTVTDEAGNAVAVSDIGFSEMELSGQLEEALPNGAYTVDWSAISQDSHEITGTLAFSVEAEEPAVAEETAETTEETVEETPAEEATDIEKETDQAAASAVEPAKAETPWITIIIIVILVIAAATFFVMARRK